MNSNEFIHNLIQKGKPLPLPEENIYKILGIENLEIKHSNFLAYLFDSKKNSNIGNSILYYFLKECNIDKILKDTSPIHNILNTSSINVYREYKNTDIIININPICTIIIENKIWADEHEKQLFKYASKIHQELNDTKGKFSQNIYKKPICIYLTPNGRPSQDKDSINWIPISYFTIHSILMKFKNTIHYKFISDKQKMLIEDYIELLKEHIMKTEKNKKELLDDFYSNKEAKNIMEEILEIIPNYKERAKIIKKECMNNDIKVIHDSGKAVAYIDIIPKSFTDIFKSMGLKENFFYFQVINNQSFKDSSIITYFNFSNNATQQNWQKANSFVQFLLNKNLTKDSSTDRALGYSFTYLTRKNEYSLTEEEKQQLIREYFSNFEETKEVQYLYNKLIEFQKIEINTTKEE